MISAENLVAPSALDYTSLHWNEVQVTETQQSFPGSNVDNMSGSVRQERKILTKRTREQKQCFGRNQDLALRDEMLKRCLDYDRGNRVLDVPLFQYFSESILRTRLVLYLGFCLYLCT